MESLIENAVEFIYPENKNIDKIVEIFQDILDSQIEDNIYNQGRFELIDKVASRIIERSTHLDTDQLSTILNHRILLVYLKWLESIN
jgi:uncharacterized protein (UPF0305 family)